MYRTYRNFLLFGDCELRKIVLNTLVILSVFIIQCFTLSVYLINMFSLHYFRKQQDVNKVKSGTVKEIDTLECFGAKF
jgi:hypothetical protein